MKLLGDIQLGVLSISMTGLLGNAGRTVILAAHPDDEVIGASAVMPQMPDLVVAHATDGAPANMHDASKLGFQNCLEYSAARRRELEEALQVGGITARLVQLPFKDQETSTRLVQLTRRVMDLLQTGDLLLTHPYEGGHPDHDACAFAAHAAACLSKSKVTLAEFTSYHAGPSGLTAGEFLGDADNATTIELTAEQKANKRTMLACFTTQAEMLRYFPVDRESFRFAPVYDFTQPPHSGRPFYENFDWGMTAARFNELAHSAMQHLGLEGRF